MPLPKKRIFNQSLLLTFFCWSILFGLALARRVDFAYGWLVLVSLGLVLLKPKSLFCLTICGLLIGLWRGQSYMNYLDEYQQVFQKPIIFLAVANSDAIYGKQSQLSFDVKKINIDGRVLPGKVAVSGLGTPMVYKGDNLQITGSLAATKGSAQARVSFAKLRVTSKGHSYLDHFKRRFIASLQSVLPEPEASFGAGLLIGQRSTIPKEINDQLSVTGLTHLVAVSGYNLTIIIVAVRQVLGKRSKFQSTFAALVLMILFGAITGLSASIIRAVLVSGLSLLAWYYGRTFRPLLLISFAAALTAAWNPFYLWSDIGWYLSFLAFFGVLILGPQLVTMFARGKNPKTVGALLAETISAQLLTLPIIMYIFGRVSVVGLVANILVVPLVPLAMLLTLTAGLGGLLVTSLAGYIAWPARILLTYMIDLTGLLSRVPHAAAQHTISLATMALAYFAILLLTVILARHNSANMVQ